MDINGIGSGPSFGDFKGITKGLFESGKQKMTEGTREMFGSLSQDTLSLPQKVASLQQELKPNLVGGMFKFMEGLRETKLWIALESIWFRMQKEFLDWMTKWSRA